MGDTSLPDHSRLQPASRLSLLTGFAIIYIVWGSTYLAIAFAVETLPPMLMAGTRFLIAGLILVSWFYWRGAQLSARQWWQATLTGALMIFGSVGLLTWGEQQHVPSGQAALFITITPIWIGLTGWLFYGEPRPGARIVVGIVAGFLGTVLLIKAPQSGVSEGSTLGYLAVFAAPIFWSIGTHQSRRFHITENSLFTSALQMLTGGVLMIFIGMIIGEWSQLSVQTISTRSILAFAYLTVIGSMIAFSTYAWLIRVASPTAVATYAYVNPLVAVTLGWLFNNEVLDWTVLLASILILGAVVVITLPVSRRPLVSTQSSAQQ